MSSEGYRVLLIADQARPGIGGEGARPLEYFARLHARGVDVRLLTHERNRRALEASVPALHDRIDYVPDAAVQRVIARLGRVVPAYAHLLLLTPIALLVTLGRARALARHWIADGTPTVVHQPTPIAVHMPSNLHDMGCPVVIGPLNGAMSYPPAFRLREGVSGLAAHALTAAVDELVARVIPGKVRADVLFHANPRTEAALPRNRRGRAIPLVANAVDTSVWRPAPPRAAGPRSLRFLFAGRLVPFKAVDLLLYAFAALLREVPAELEVVGDGPLRRRLEAQAARLGIARDVRFTGWLHGAELVRAFQGADAFVFPSLREAGGAVILEAMSVGLPVIAARWGGPEGFVTPQTGFLVDCSSRRALVAGMTSAMLALARDAALRSAMGQAGRAYVVEGHDWEHRIDALLDVYRGLVSRASVPGAGTPQPSALSAAS